MPKFKYKAVIFDFDGVLVDSVNIKGQAFRRIYEFHGDEIADKVHAYHMENGGVSRREKFKHYAKEFFNKELDACEIEDLSDQFSNIVTNMVVNASWIAGAKEFLDKHHEELSLYVASATPEEELLDIIKKRAMDEYFVSIKGSPTKKSDNIKHIIEQAGIEKNEIVMIGDSKTDYDAANKNDIDFIAVGQDTYLREHCACRIDSLIGLRQKLMEQS